MADSCQCRAKTTTILLSINKINKININKWKINKLIKINEKKRCKLNEVLIYVVTKSLTQ